MQGRLSHQWRPFVHVFQGPVQASGVLQNPSLHYIIALVFRPFFLCLRDEVLDHPPINADRNLVSVVRARRTFHAGSGDVLDRDLFVDFYAHADR